MIDLIERAPDDWHEVVADGSPPAILFYYGVRCSEVHLLPMGSAFGVVRSPNFNVHPQSPLRPWAYTVFEVCLYQYRPGRGLERSYRQVRRRQLSRFEVPHFEALWLEINLMGRKTG